MSTRSIHRTGVTESVARKIYEKFCHEVAYDLPPLPTVEQGCDYNTWAEMSPKLCRNLEDTCDFGIAWEEGPYEWVFEMDDALQSIADQFGVRVEAIASWGAVGFYKN